MSSPSRKSDSGSIKRPDLLARKPRVRQTADADLRWLWAAYQMGKWRELMDKGLTQDGFSERILDVMSSADHDWIIEARGEEGIRPIGLVLGSSIGSGRVIEPFVDWFPWATNRNQLEGAAAFLKYVSKQFKIMVFAEESAVPFWNRLIKHGLIRRGCKVTDYFSPGENAMMYYTPTGPT